MASNGPAAGDDDGGVQLSEVTPKDVAVVDKAESTTGASHAHHADDEEDDANAPFDPRDPFKGTNPLETLPLRELFLRGPTLLWQYWVASFLYYKDHPSDLKRELLSGATISTMQVPESVAFSFVARVDPLSGLFSTVFLGFITGAIGGKPGLVSGAAGAMAVVAQDITDPDGPLKDLTKAERLEHLWITMTFCGIIQMLFGFFGLAKLVRLIPQTVMIGFVNALAIIIFISQLTAFKTCDTEGLFIDCEESQREWLSISDSTTWALLVIVFCSMVIMHLYPRIPKVGKMLPASLVAMVFACAWEHGMNRQVFDTPTRIVEETAKVDGEFPPFDIGDVGGTSHWDVIFEYAFVLAAIGLVESVMTLGACDEITSTPQSVFRSNQESVAQGVGNLVSSVFGAMGGDAMIGQSTINIMNGAKGRVSSMSAGIFLLIFILVASPVIELIPVAGLTGVLFMVVLHTFHWATFKKLFRIRRTDAFVIVLTTVLAVIFNLAVAVVAGCIFTSLANSWDMGRVLKITRTRKVDHHGHPMVLYKFQGALFFGSTTEFKDAFDVKRDPPKVVADFTQSLVSDYSGVAAIKSVYKRYRLENKHFEVRHLSTASRVQFRREKKLSHALNLHAASPTYSEPKSSFASQTSGGAGTGAGVGVGVGAGAGGDAERKAAPSPHSAVLAASGARAGVGADANPNTSQPPSRTTSDAVLIASGARAASLTEITRPSTPPEPSSARSESAPVHGDPHQPEPRSLESLEMFQVPEVADEEQLEAQMEALENNSGTSSSSSSEAGDNPATSAV